MKLATLLYSASKVEQEDGGSSNNGASSGLAGGDDDAAEPPLISQARAHALRGVERVATCYNT